ncbi:hypothetical protein AGMMS49531_11530 [Endomicrobiia bacterium]|nr:hypothetical protein AGMMS49531_11530 [Endomicrobiia bacterium]
MEESERLLGKHKKHVEAFAGGSLGKLSYKTDKINPQETKTRSLVAGVAMTLELGEKDLTTAIFGEFGTGDSKIECYKESSNATGKCIGGGLFAKYDLYKDESIGQKTYLELVLRAGQITNAFFTPINTKPIPPDPHAFFFCFIVLLLYFYMLIMHEV